MDEEIITLNRPIENLQMYLADPSVSVRRSTSLQRRLAAAHTHLAALLAIADRRRNAAGLSIMRIS